MQKQRTLSHATDLQKEITEVAFDLLLSCWNPSSPVRLLSVTGSGLVGADEDFVQMDLFSAGAQTAEKQEKCTDPDSLRLSPENRRDRSPVSVRLPNSI